MIRTVLIVCLVALPVAADAAALTLVRDGKSPYVIVVAERLRAEEDPRIISVSQNDWGGRCWRT